MATAGKTKVGGEVLVPEATPEPTIPALTLAQLQERFGPVASMTATREDVLSFLADCVKTYEATKTTAEADYEKATAKAKADYEKAIAPFKAAFEKACEPHKAILDTPNFAVTLHNSVVMFVKAARADVFGDARPLTRGKGRSGYTYGGALESAVVETPEPQAEAKQ